jgi:hypothetical protein
LGLNTGGQSGSGTQSGTSTPGAAGDVRGAINAAGGLGSFATPSSLFQLTPAERTFQGLGMGLNLPGSEASRALSYANSAPFADYFRNFTAPTILNNAITSGYGGASGAAMEALQRGGTQAAMQGLTSFGMPMAQADQANVGQGMNYAGAQRQASLQDFGRIQQLIQSLLGYLPTSTTGSMSGNQSTQGPGAAASLLNMGGGILGSLFNGGLGGSQGSLGGQLLGGLGSLGSSAWNGLSSLFGSGGSTGSGQSDYLSSMNMPITDSGVAQMDPMMQSWLAGTM